MLVQPKATAVNRMGAPYQDVVAITLMQLDANNQAQI
jgi:hypothetical protein